MFQEICSHLVNWCLSLYSYVSALPALHSLSASPNGTVGLWIDRKDNLVHDVYVGFKENSHPKECNIGVISGWFHDLWTDVIKKLLEKTDRGRLGDFESFWLYKLESRNVSFCVTSFLHTYTLTKKVSSILMHEWSIRWLFTVHCLVH